MPSLEVLAKALEKRNAPIKAVLLDQNGVGHFRADEPRRID